jgi:hypothetical protein
MAQNNFADIPEEVKEHIKKIEDGIKEKIDKFNNEVKDIDIEENNYRSYQSQAYIYLRHHKKLIDENRKVPEEILNKIDDLEIKIQLSQDKLLADKGTALVSLNNLYKEHVDYLAKIANGLREQCERLQPTSTIPIDTATRADNIKENTPQIAALRRREANTS